jgi:hypothetical protein
MQSKCSRSRVGVATVLGLIVVLSLSACQGIGGVPAGDDTAPLVNDAAADDGEGKRPRAATAWVPEKHLNDIAGAAGAMRNEAERRWPDEFTEVWIDRRTIVLAFTDGAEEKVAELREAIDQPFALRAADGRAVEEIYALRARVQRDRESLAAGSPPRGMPQPIIDTEGVYDVYDDIMSGVAVVAVKRLTPELQQAFTDFYGELLRVEEGMMVPGG